MSAYQEDNGGRREDRGTTTLVLGILALVFSVVGLRLVSIVLGIIAVCLSHEERHYSESANAGFIMGVIAISLSLVIVVAALFLSFSILMPFFWLV